ncbi:unnamed protein product [Calypogeia fissa]
MFVEAFVERGGPEEGRKKARSVQTNVGGASVGGDEGGEEAAKQWVCFCEWRRSRSSVGYFWQPVLAAPELSFVPALSFHGNLTTVEAFIRIFSWTLEDNLSRSCFC